MRVHVVTRDLGTDHIFARLLHELEGKQGWTFGTAPDPKADINYYFPFLVYDGFKGTPTAAWFTHREDTRPEKAEMWDRVAQSVDLRLTSARMYESGLAQYGPTRRVTTPIIDPERFTPIAKRVMHEPPVIGTSGYVYPGGRKGEGLIKSLVDSDLGQRVRVVASGKGWPCACTERAWSDMPSFYRGLDVYLCTSLIEGIGYGPLEALACGIPVVIPRGVGVFDELPSVQNLHRYEAGDFEDMCRAIEASLAEPYNGESLRGIVSRFSRDAWRGEHRTAFEDFLYGAPPIAELPEWHGRAGVYMVAYGDPARECAKRAINSIHKQMPGLPVALASSEPLGPEDIFINHADEDLGARSAKTRIYDLAPVEWQYVLYLDADTEAVQPFGFLFDVLADGWEMAFCLNPAQYVIAREMRRPDNAEECQFTFDTVGTEEFLQLNGGVFSFRRNKRTARFFHDWHEEWMRYAKRDQAALDRALYAHPLRVYALNGVWNCITRYKDVDPKDGVILHYPMMARRWRGMVNGRLDSSEAWAALHPSGK